MAAPSAKAPLAKRSSCTFKTASDCSIPIPPEGPICTSSYGMVKDGVGLTQTGGGCDDEDCNYGATFGFEYDGLTDDFLYSGQGDEAGCPSGCKGAYGAQSALVGTAYANALATDCGCSVTFDC